MTADNINYGVNAGKKIFSYII